MTEKTWPGAHLCVMHGPTRAPLSFFIACGARWTTAIGIFSGKPRLGRRNLLLAPLHSPRISANVRALIVSGGPRRDEAWISHAMLRRAVNSLPNLRRLVVGPLYFDYLFPCDAKRVIYLQRHIEHLVLHSIPDSSPAQISPSLLDVLPWFNTIDHLELIQQGSREHTWFLANANHAWKVAVKKLTANIKALQMFVEDLHPLGFVDLQSLVDLTVISEEPIALPVLDTFFKIYAGRLEHCSLALHYNFHPLASGKYICTLVGFG